MSGGGPVSRIDVMGIAPGDTPSGGLARWRSVFRGIGWVSGGFDTTHNGADDAFVAKLSPSVAHLWSAYLGGSSMDDGYGIAVDGSGNIVVTGFTYSSGWVSGGFDTTPSWRRSATSQ